MTEIMDKIGVLARLQSMMSDFTYEGEKSLECSLHLVYWQFICVYTSGSITCIQRTPKGSNKSGLLQQVVFKCRLC